MKKTKIYILDTSAVLSGKNTDFASNSITATGVSEELSPGGKDYQFFQFLKEKGLKVFSPSKKNLEKTKEHAKKTGDLGRLSNTDIELLALALDIKKQEKTEPILITDDYSIQNLANSMDIKYKTISQQGIKESFIWINKCQGCGKKFKENINNCPICGSKTKKVILEKRSLDS